MRLIHRKHSRRIGTTIKTIKESSNFQRSQNLKRIHNLKTGAKFVRAVKRYARTEKGIEPVINNWLEECLLALGDFRVGDILTTGAAQIGKTLSHTWLICWILTEYGINTGWFYSTRESMDAQVPEQFRPVIRYWLEQANIKPDREDRKINSRYQVKGATGIFSYVSTSRSTPSREGLAKAGSAAVSVQVNLAVFEERSQWPIGSADPLPRRLDASVIATKPIRELGTPGSGAGIEAGIKSVQHNFYPHCQCPHCNRIFPLDPKGCLLRQSKRRNALGRETVGYLSESGRPLQWFENISCPECHGLLTSEFRSKRSWMQCRLTGVELRDYLDQLPNVPPTRQKIALHFSPLVRDSETLAGDIIREGNSCLDTTDWQQQMLGHPSENLTASLTIEILERAIARQPISRKPDCVCAGIDVGRSSDWMCVTAYFLPDNVTEINQQIELATRRVLWIGDISRGDIVDYLRRLNVTFGLIDNEPDREAAMKIVRESCLQIADQKSTQREPVTQIKVTDGGVEYDCWGIRSEKFMNQVLNGFLVIDQDGNPLYQLPEYLENWRGNLSDRSPFRHFTAPRRGSDGKWKRDNQGIDDLFFATHFCEAAFYLWMTEIQNSDARLLRKIL